MNGFPRFEISAFSDRGEMSKALELESLLDDANVTKFCCVTKMVDEYVMTKSFILVEGYEPNNEFRAILCHEVSHAVDAFLSRMQERDAGTETRAYLMQSAYEMCLDQLEPKGRR